MVERVDFTSSTEGGGRFKPDDRREVADGLARCGEGLEIPVRRLEGADTAAFNDNAVLHGMGAGGIVGIARVDEGAEQEHREAGPDIVFGQLIGTGLGIGEVVVVLADDQHRLEPAIALRQGHRHRL